MEFLGPGRIPSFAPLKPTVDQGEGLEKTTKGHDPETERAGLRKAAQEFEGVFLNTLMKAMRKTVPENDLFNGGGATKFYRQMHDAEMAKALATANGGLGIADMIVEQLTAREPAQREDVLGPPAPTGPRTSVIEPEVSRYLSLRRMAASSQTAEADTLRRFEPEIHAAADAADVDPALILSVVMEESGGDPSAVSSAGARGLMQLMPDTAREVGVADPDNAAQNLKGGSKYLARMIRAHDGDLPRALAAYNAGPGAVARAGGRIPDYPETRRYVARVMDRYQRLTRGTHLALSR